MPGRIAHIPTARCRVCDCPGCDHIPFRYWFRCWRRHLFWSFVDKLGRP